MNAGYIVCRDRMPLTASHIHVTLDHARAEAERLCRKEQAKFLILAVIGEITIAETPVTWKWATDPATTTTTTPCPGSGSGWCPCPPDTDPEDGDPTP